MRKRQRKVSNDPPPITTQRNSLPNISENSLPVPIDLIIDIFSKLPLKSIARCRCVSKLWASILRLPDFTELFFTNSSSRHKLLFVCSKDSEFFFFSADQPQNVDENTSPPPVVAKYLMKFLFDGSYYISGVFNGLVCLLSREMKEIMPMICNPSTGQVLNLPILKSKWVTVKRGFGYDPVDKRVIVLSMTRSVYGSHKSNVDPEEYRVLTVGAGKLSWRKIEGGGLRSFPSSEICVNGVMYSQYVIMLRYMIVCFDVRSEKFSFVDVELPEYTGTMIDYNGKLGLYWIERLIGLNGSSKILRLWVLEDIGKQEWSEREYLLPALLNDLVWTEKLWSVEVTRENEFVFLFSGSQPYLIYFNLERNTTVRVEIQGIDTSKYDRLSTFLYHVEDVKLM